MRSISQSVEFWKLTLFYGRCAAALVGATCTGPCLCSGQETNRYFRYVGDLPPPGGAFNSFFSEQISGVANDDSNWFFAQSASGTIPRAAVWKVPFSANLHWEDLPPPPGSVGRTLPLGIDHLGDLDQLGGFVFVPASGSSGLVILVLRASDLTTVTSAAAEGGSWCAVFPSIIDGQAYIYADVTAEGHGIRYRFSWNDLAGSGQLGLTPDSDLVLRKDGSPWIPPLPFAQAGAFSPDGRMLYLYYGENQDVDPDAMDWGIHAFALNEDGTLGDWVARSSSGNSDALFFCQFTPASYWSQEPEGLTCCDLDDGRAYNVFGQLHALIRDNLGTPTGMIFKHYSSVLYVDKSYTGSQQGTLIQPFTAVGAAINFMSAKSRTSGVLLKITSASYPESATFDKPMNVVPVGGLVTIGGP